MEFNMSEQPGRIFNIEKIYVKDLSLEIPGAPMVFLEEEAPGVDMQLRLEDHCISEGMYEVVLIITITARIKDKTMFLDEARQAGIFQIRNLDESEMGPVLGIACPNVIFPYIRETISDVVTRAGFPPVILSQVNFEALYNQSKQQIDANATVTENIKKKH